MKFGDEEWQEMTAQFEQSFKDLEQQQEEYWASLTKEQQLDLFCCVVRRLVKGELEDNRSYRGILYDIFEWGPEAYATAQMAGYINLHNAIFKKERLHEILVGVLKEVEVDIDPEVLNQELGKHGVWV
jgi:hypothetical protein